MDFKRLSQDKLSKAEIESELVDKPAISWLKEYLQWLLQQEKIGKKDLSQLSQIDTTLLFRDCLLSASPLVEKLPLTNVYEILRKTSAAAADPVRSHKETCLSLALQGLCSWRKAAFIRLYDAQTFCRHSLLLHKLIEQSRPGLSAPRIWASLKHSACRLTSIHGVILAHAQDTPLNAVLATQNMGMPAVSNQIEFVIPRGADVSKLCSLWQQSFPGLTLDQGAIASNKIRLVSPLGFEETPYFSPWLWQDLQALSAEDKAELLVWSLSSAMLPEYIDFTMQALDVDKKLLHWALEGTTNHADQLVRIKAMLKESPDNGLTELPL